MVGEDAAASGQSGEDDGDAGDTGRGGTGENGERQGEGGKGEGKARAHGRPPERPKASGKAGEEGGKSGDPGQPSAEHSAEHASKDTGDSAGPSPHGGDEHRRHRVLNQGHSTLKARYTQPIVAKHGNLFLVCSRDGDITGGTEQGLYFRDMRYLCDSHLRLDGQALQPLLVNASAGSVALFELSNPDLPGGTDELRIRKETLGVRRELRLGEDLSETITIRNHATERAEFTLAMDYGADFVDMFEVRGTPPGKRGTIHDPAWQDGALCFEYDGADKHTRTLRIVFDPRPDHTIGQSLGWRVSLPNQQTWQLAIHLAPEDRAPGGHTYRPRREDAPPKQVVDAAHSGSIGRGTAVETSNQLFNEVLGRSLLDLHMLSMREAGQEFFGAGVPWYVALFGRDSLLTALEMAAFDPGIASHTLRVLAEHQGTKVDDFHDEQPGKILHELRFGEMANLGEVPQTPYYGSVDSTPLFLVLLAEHAQWTGTLDVFHELGDHVKDALEWIDRYGDSDGDGLIDYKTKSSKGLRNQGWKDSFNGIVMDDGQLAKLPVALPEVQSWVYRAWLGTADLRRRDGDENGAKELEAKAEALQKRFEEAFWLDDAGYYGLCREDGGTVSRVISSNGIHALAGGIVPATKAKALAKRAFQSDMFSGWGIRTLSANAVAYNPIDYQVGSIWPHDNAFISAGLHRYGFTTEANRVFEAIYDAAIRFTHFRLPEVFAGYDRTYSSEPVHYPVACSPQAWAAASIPLMLQASLGLEPAGFEHELRIVRPALPSFFEWVKVRGLQVGGAKADLRFERAGGQTLVAVERVSGDLRVTIEY